jgi:hypothetical protein
MLIRVCLIIAIVAGLGAGVVSFVKVRERLIETMNARDEFEQDRNRERSAKQKALAELRTTQESLTTTSNTLVTTQADLQRMTVRFTEQETRANALTIDLDRTRGQRDEAQRELAKWEGVGLTPDQVRGVIASVTKLEAERDTFRQENQILLSNNKQLQTRLDIYEDPDRSPPMPGVKGTVLAVDPKYDFVVLDIGAEQGVLERGELLINRNGQFIAKVRVATVESNRSVANVIPEWKRDEIMEGDLVFY